MDFDNLEAFAAIVEFGGFTRAAEALHLSQPALSRRIGLLEHELRQQVFERGRRGAALTDAGRTFLPHAQAALACLRDGAAAVQALARGESGSLTLAIVGTLASTGLTAQLGRFRAAHPELRVLLRTGSSAEVSSLVRRGEAALGLRYFADPAPDVVSRSVYAEPMVVAAAPGNRLAGLRRIAPERLRGETWVAFPAKRGAAADSFGQLLSRCLAAAGLDAAEIVVIDSLTAQKRLVEAGLKNKESVAQVAIRLRPLADRAAAFAPLQNLLIDLYMAQRDFDGVREVMELDVVVVADEPIFFTEKMNDRRRFKAD